MLIDNIKGYRRVHQYTHMIGPYLTERLSLSSSFWIIDLAYGRY
jgi:hypothetical protein